VTFNAPSREQEEIMVQRKLNQQHKYKGKLLLLKYYVYLQYSTWHHTVTIQMSTLFHCECIEVAETFTLLAWFGLCSRCTTVWPAVWSWTWLAVWSWSWPSSWGTWPTALPAAWSPAWLVTHGTTWAGAWTLDSGGECANGYGIVGNEENRW